MKLLTIILAFSLIFSVKAVEKARYDFYRVYEVKIENEIHLKLMNEISAYPDGYQFIGRSEYLGGICLLIVPPHKFGDWSELVEKYSMNVRIKTKNLQDQLDKHDQDHDRKRSKRSVTLDWTRFLTLDEIYEWLQEKIDSRPVDLSWFDIGKSFEGRDIKGLKINVGNVTGKPTIFYESLIHGLEWLTTSSSLYIINELLTDGNLTSILDQFEWYFLPVLNVDGYAYSWSNNRFWRKTRRPSSNSITCVGADPNRNSDVHWNTSYISVNPCANNYPGDNAFSEPEIRQWSEFMKTVKNLTIYFTFHSFGQIFMIPVGYTATHIPNYNLHWEIAEIANEEIYKASNYTVKYRLGHIIEFFGLLSGLSSDWVYDNIHPKFIFNFEVRPNRWESPDEAEIVSPGLIIPTAIDMYSATMTIIKEIVRRGEV